jgi:hypothetical protein
VLNIKHPFSWYLLFILVVKMIRFCGRSLRVWWRDLLSNNKCLLKEICCGSISMILIPPNPNLKTKALTKLWDCFYKTFIITKIIDFLIHFTGRSIKVCWGWVCSKPRICWGLPNVVYRKRQANINGPATMSTRHALNAWNSYWAMSTIDGNSHAYLNPLNVHMCQNRWHNF